MFEEINRWSLANIWMGHKGTSAENLELVLGKTAALGYQTWAERILLARGDAVQGASSRGHPFAVNSLAFPATLITNRPYTQLAFWFLQPSASSFKADTPLGEIFLPSLMKMNILMGGGSRGKD